MLLPSLAKHRFVFGMALLASVLVLSLLAVLGITTFRAARSKPSLAHLFDTTVRPATSEKTVRPGGAATSIAASTNGGLIVFSFTAGRDPMDGVQVLPVATLRGENLDVGSGLQWAKVAFAPDGATFLVGGNWIVPRGRGSLQKWEPQGVLQIWDARSRSRRHRIVVGDEDVGHIAYDPKGRYVYFTYSWLEDKSIRRLDLRTEKITDVITAASHFTAPWTPKGSNELCVSPDGRTLVVGSTDGTLVWSLREAKERFLGPPSRSVAISPDGSQLALACYRNLQVVDTGTGKRIRRLTIDDRVLDKDRRFARFSSDGQILAAGMNDCNEFPSYLAVWKTPDYSPLAVFCCHNCAMLDMCFMPNTHTLVTASMDDTVSFWDLDKPHSTNCSNGERTEPTY